jgi:hypothetical protein
MLNAYSTSTNRSGSGGNNRLKNNKLRQYQNNRINVSNNNNNNNNTSVTTTTLEISSYFSDSLYSNFILTPMCSEAISPAMNFNNSNSFLKSPSIQNQVAAAAASLS